MWCSLACMCPQCWYHMLQWVKAIIVQCVHDTTILYTMCPWSWLLETPLFFFWLRPWLLCGQQVTFSIQWDLDNLTLCGQQVTFSIQWNLDNLTLCGQQVTFSIQWALDNLTLCGQQVTFSIQWDLDNLTLCGQQVTFSIQWDLDNLTLCGQQVTFSSGILNKTKSTYPKSENIHKH